MKIFASRKEQFNLVVVTEHSIVTKPGAGQVNKPKRNTSGCLKLTMQTWGMNSRSLEIGCILWHIEMHIGWLSLQ